MNKVCEKCRKEYDSKEKVCPDCGGRLRKKLTRQEIGWMIVLAGGVIAVIINLW